MCNREFIMFKCQVITSGFWFVNKLTFAGDFMQLGKFFTGTKLHSPMSIFIFKSTHHTFRHLMMKLGLEMVHDIGNTHQ